MAMLNSILNPGSLGWSFFDVLRILVVCGAVCLVGANTAFWIHTPRIFPEQNATIWRLFFIGKSLITGSMALLIWNRVQEGSPISLAAWVGMLGVLITNLSLFLLYRSGRIKINISGGDHAGKDDN